MSSQETEPQIILKNPTDGINIPANFGKFFDDTEDAFKKYLDKPKYSPQFYWLVEDAVAAYMLDLKKRSSKKGK